MEHVNGNVKRKGRCDPERRSLLAKVHIAKKDLNVDEALYRMILREEYGVESAKDLNNRELGQLVARFEEKGWEARTTKNGPRTTAHDQCEALRERIGQELLQSKLTPERYRGLVKKICRVEDVKWCRNVDRLKKLVAVIRRIR